MKKTANYRVEFYAVNPRTHEEEPSPREIFWFTAAGLSKKHIDNIRLGCTWDDLDIVARVYRNDSYIGIVEVNQRTPYTTISYVFGRRCHVDIRWGRKTA